MKTILETVTGLCQQHVSPLTEGGLVKTSLETAAAPCQLPASHFTKGGLVKTNLEIAGLHWRMSAGGAGGAGDAAGAGGAGSGAGGVGFHWRMQAVLMEGGLVKTILEIVAEHC